MISRLKKPEKQKAVQRLTSISEFVWGTHTQYSEKYKETPDQHPSEKWQLFKGKLKSKKKRKLPFRCCCGNKNGLHRAAFYIHYPGAETQQHKHIEQTKA